MELMNTLRWLFGFPERTPTGKQAPTKWVSPLAPQARFATKLTDLLSWFLSWFGGNKWEYGMIRREKRQGQGQEGENSCYIASLIIPYLSVTSLVDGF